MNPIFAAQDLTSLAADLGIAQDLAIKADGNAIVIHDDITGEDTRCATFEDACDEIRNIAASA